jgi:hypothetical protein
MKRVFVIVAALILTAFFTGCKKDDHSNGNIFYGTPQNVGNGAIRSYVEFNGKGIPQAIGFKFT